MKKNLLLFIIVVILFFVGCPIENETRGNDNNQNEPNLAKVIIPLPEASRARAVGLINAKNYTNFYQVVFRKDNDGNPIFYQTTAMASEGKIEINIPTGIYDILLLAGCRPDGNTPLLLASSYILDRSIVLDQVNEINMVLATIDIDIVAPNNVSLAQQFNFEIKIETKNTIINENGLLYVYYFDGVSSMNAGSSVLKVSDTTNEVDLIEKNIFMFKNTAVAPLNPSTGSIRISSTFYVYNNNNLGNWRIADYNFPDLGSYFEKSINFIDGQVMPEVIMNITWPEE